MQLFLLELGQAKSRYDTAAWNISLLFCVFQTVSGVVQHERHFKDVSLNVTNLYREFALGYVISESGLSSLKHK